MKKINHLLLTCLVSVSSICFAEPGDTTKIRIHDAVDMVWYGNYDQAASFPDGSVSYNKILMHYTMGCASGGCSAWDYTTKIELRKSLGFDSTMQITVISEDPYMADTTWTVFEVKESFELARVITPYGGYMQNNTNGYNSNWKHVHTFDVTDYAPFLQGETEIRAFYGGWSSGFSVTLDFDFIEGTPPREVLEIKNLWRSGGNGWNYQNSAHFDSTYTVPLTVDFPQTFDAAKIRFVPTGHGFDNNVNCAEFCQRNYYFSLDGTQFASNNMWDDKCGENPIYPQGGTWLYDRANWCPGLRAHHFDHDISHLVNQGESHVIDLDIQTIVWSGAQAPNYIFETQLFIYGPKNFQHDAAIEEIIAPTNNSNYRRFNPVCNQAIVKIKNYGEQNLTSATIRYAVNDNNWREFQWTGNLAFDETEDVFLPLTEAWEWVSVDGTNRFDVEIVDPNQAMDENEHNNFLSSTFVTTIKLPSSMVFQFRTNSKPEESSWTLHDAYGALLSENVPNMEANNMYSDTLDLAPGCYVLKINDSGKNGLSFWANNDGAGFARFRVGSAIIHNFRADFGTSIALYFTVGYSLDMAEFLNQEPEVLVFPNPNEGQFTLVFDNVFAEDVSIELVNTVGQVFDSRSVFIDDNNQEVYFDMNSLQAGAYFVLITTKNSRIVKQIVVK